jgi:hypothetical protein
VEFALLVAGAPNDGFRPLGKVGAGIRHLGESSGPVTLRLQNLGAMHQTLAAIRHQIGLRRTPGIEFPQNRYGNVPMDAGSFATDFDEVFSFKSLPLWWQAVGPTAGAKSVGASEAAPAQRFNQYTGAPLPQEGE